VHWKGDDDQEHFTLRCGKEEQLRLWETAINRLIQDIQTKRAADRAEKAALSRQNSTNPALPPMHPLIPNHQQMHSQSSNGLPPFPAPPQGMPMQGRYRSATETQMASGPNYYPRNSNFNGFEEDEMDSDYGYGSSTYSASGRGTPLSRRGAATQSMPPERDPSLGHPRDRARTEDPTGQLLREWTRVPAPLAPAPTGALPPTPAQRPGMGRVGSAMSGNSGPDGARPQLRSQFSSNRMRSQYEEGSPHDLQRYPSQSSTASTSTSSPVGTPPLNGRSRSASQPSHPSFNTKSQEIPPPLPNGAGTWTRGHNGTDSSYDGRTGKRGSGSSQSTGTGSSDYSPPQTVSPVTPYGSHDGHHQLRQQRSQVFTGSSSASGSRATTPAGFPLNPPIKVKVHYREDLFVISVPRTTEYDDLLDKVGKKIRLCGPRRDDMPLRVRYRDEDGDMVSLASNEDVQLAFEAPHVTLYVQ
jgi:cell division control protein 24